MNNFVIILVGFFAFIHTGKASEADTIKIQTKTYCDHCKKCGSCWPKMENRLQFTPGVKSVSFDEKTMAITVIYSRKKTTPEKIRTVISKTGFDADNVKADIEAQGKLDDCCRKK